MKFYHNNNEDVLRKNPFCCEHMEDDWYNESLTFKCFEGNKIKIFGLSEQLAKPLTECPYCHEKIETVYEGD